MLKLLNAVGFLGLFGLDLDAGDTVFILYLAQAAIVFIGLIMFFILLARTRRSRKKVVEQVVVEEVKEVRKEKKKEEAKPVVAETAATTAAEPQPEVIVVNPNPVIEPAKEKVERVLTGISLDVGVVQREFTVGEDFNCDGLLVRANYNVEPLSETIIAYSVVDSEVYDRLSNVSEIKVCYVLRPELSEAGIRFVTVKYADQTAIYTVSVKNAPAVEEQPAVEAKEEKPAEPEKEVVVVEKVVEKPVVVERIVEVQKEAEKQEEPVAAEPARDHAIIIEEESLEAGRLRYDRSFTARFIQSDDDVKHWYTELKNELLSYKKVHARTSWKRETFKSGKEVVAKLAYRGKTLCLFLPLSAADYENTAYPLEDASNIPSAEETPSMLRLKNYKRVRLAIELVEIAMQQKGITRVKHVSEDFYVPYEGVVELINKGLIKREIKSSKDEAIFGQEVKAANDADSSTITEIATGVFVSAKTLDEADSSEELREEPVAKTEEDEKTSDKKRRKSGRAAK